MTKTSFYARTPKVDFYLDIWRPIEIPETDLDTLYIIEPKYAYRPDLLAEDLYGSSEYWFVFALRNKDVINDPIFDFVPGKEIFLPPANVIRVFGG